MMMMIVYKDGVDDDGKIKIMVKIMMMVIVLIMMIVKQLKTRNNTAHIYIYLGENYFSLYI